MPDIARRMASRTISSVWSAYSIDALYFTDGAKSGFLADELDAAAANPSLGDPGALAAEEDHRRVLHLGAHDRARDVGHTGPERADAQARAAGHS